MVALFIILAIIVVLVGIMISVYNGCVKLKNQAEEAYAQIDAHLKQRYDLIPNLVETVKGYAKHEEGTLTAVIEARNKAMSATGVEDKDKADKAFEGTLKSRFALAEAYPDLKANTNFMDLQNQLTNLEKEILQARKYYNGVVKTFNTNIETFPNSLIVKIFGGKFICRGCRGRETERQGSVLISQPMKKILLLALVLVLGVSSLFAVDYYIRDYQVYVEVGINGVHHIEEYITVYFEGPHHGIVREIPVDYRDYNGKTLAKVKNIFCSENYSSSYDNGYLVMQIGDANKTVTGRVDYTITYDYDLGADFNEGYDEIYLNLVGTYWECPIDFAVFHVFVPYQKNEEWTEYYDFLNHVAENTYMTCGYYGSTLDDDIAAAAAG